MRNLPLPGMAAISIWMLALALLGVAGVLTGHYPSGGPRVGILILCSVFAAAGLGLIRMRFGCYSLFRFRQGQWVVMAVINLVFFLYLVRPEVTGRLR